MLVRFPFQGRDWEMYPLIFGSGWSQVSNPWCSGRPQAAGSEVSAGAGQSFGRAMQVVTGGSWTFCAENIG